MLFIYLFMYLFIKFIYLFIYIIIFLIKRQLALLPLKDNQSPALDTSIAHITNLI